MEYTKLKYINQYKSESINPAKTPDTVFELYSVPVYETGHPEYLRGDEIASNKAIVQKNDVLLCKINPRINRVWIVSDESDKKNIASSEWIVIRNNEYNPEFLAWYFRSNKFQRLMTSEVTGIGGSLTRAQPKCVAEYPVPILDREKQDKYLLKDEDIVFVRSNGNKDLVGRCLVVYPGNLPTTFSGFCIRYRKYDKEIAVSYLLRVLKMESMRRKMTGRGANIQNLNQQILGTLVIPIPPIELQNQFSDFTQAIDKSEYDELH